MTNMSPAADHLLTVRDLSLAKLLPEEQAIAFHHATAQLLFLSARAWQNTQPATAFLITWVRSLDEDDWGKVKRVLGYLKGTLQMPLILLADLVMLLRWWVDVASTVIANILFNMIDDELQIPMKCQGYLDMYNGVDVMQTKNYIKTSCKSFIEKIFKKKIISWMQNFTSTKDRPTPLPTDPMWFKQFNAAIGNPDPKGQSKLAKKMQITYCCNVGELIWAMTSTRPDLAFTSVTSSQANPASDEHHYHGVKHVLKYLYSTCDDAIYFWRTAPNLDFPEGPLTTINSNK
jgi:hypothetical protein